MLEGDWQGAVGQCCSAFRFRESIFTTMLWSSKIIEDIASAVRRGKLWSSTEVDCASHLSTRCLDHGCAVAVPIKCKDPRSSGIVNDGIGVLAGRHLTDCLESLQIENGNS
jgi:hypothetical protein